MLKNEMIKSVARETGISPDLVRRVVESIHDHTVSAVRQGSEVMLLGLGKISISRRGAKPARNIHTGDPVIVPPRNVPVFRPSVALTKAAQEFNGE